MHYSEMHCSLFQSLLDQAIESHADTVSTEVREHGLSCANPACQQAWSEYALLARTIPLWRSQLPQVDLADRVLLELSPPAPEPDQSHQVSASPALKAYLEQSWTDFRSPQQRPWSIALVVVALMLMIGTLTVSTPHSPNTDIAVRQRHNPTIEQRSAPHLPGWAPHEPPASNVAVQSVEWAQKASHLMADVIVSIPEKSADWVPSDGWEVNWLDRLEPLRRNAHDAWDALIDTLPMQDPPAS